MTTALVSLPAHVRARLASALETGVLAPPYTPAALALVTGSPDPAALDALQELAAQGIEGHAAAALLRMLDEALARTPSPDFVWSGPEVHGLHARDTRRVYEELLGSARRRVWASTYAFFDGRKAFEVLADRMDELPELEVVLLLNIQRKKGDTSSPDEVVRRFTDHFWAKDWPGKRRPRVFYDRRSLELDGPAGVLHAKTVVVDDLAVFVTSANMTEAALDRNIEVGLLTRDRPLALTVSKHFQVLIEQGLLSPLPQE